MSSSSNSSKSGDDVESVSCRSEHSECEGSTARSSNESTEKAEQLAKRETEAVFKLRLLVILVLIAAASAVSVVVYMITGKAEQDEFNTQYEGVSEKVLEAFQGIVETRLAAISSLAVAAIAHGVDHSKPWPFVPLSSFQQRSTTVRKLSGAFFLSINPIVSNRNRQRWEEYIVGEGGEWIQEAAEYQQDLGIHVDCGKFAHGQFALEENRTSWPIYSVDEQGNINTDEGYGPFLPYSQTSPLVEWNMVNQNLATTPLTSTEALMAMSKKSVILGDIRTAANGDSASEHFWTVYYTSLMSANAGGKPVDYQGDPIMRAYFPIFSSFREDREAVAVMMVFLRWRTYFERILPPTVSGIQVVLENTCSGSYTFEIDGEDVKYLGDGDLHDPHWDHMEKYASFAHIDTIADGTKYGLNFDQEYCPISIHVYPAQDFYNNYITKTPSLITACVAIVFVFTILMFLVYDWLVERRQRIVLQRAQHTTAIVSSLFPKNVTDRMLQINGSKDNGGGYMSKNSRLKSFLNDSDGGKDDENQPIADLIPHSTVLFSDIAGFTAWSSAREPTQVFILLQSVYQAFDAVAKKRKVFKVETIGDSYMAVTGLPDPQENHALIMARFARECLQRFQEVTRELEVTLGPDTGDLAMRFGLHSGPVTAGVLRGDRARFQLFGDTVNTAARMESTGQRNKIQISETTAQILIEAGKDHWVKPRDDSVNAKGKGVLNTYWLTLNPKKGTTTKTSESGSATDQVAINDVDAKQRSVLKHDRLVDWVSEIIADNMKKLVFLRKGTSGSDDISADDLVYRRCEHKTHIDDIGQAIIMPAFDAKKAESAMLQTSSIELDPGVKDELRQYVNIIAAAYHNNPFHNFEHACHVTMSVSKLLSRIVTPDLDVDKNKRTSKDGIMSQIHDYTYGINSDPLAHVAIIFSALIHDVDHRGVSNVQLAKEEPGMAALYRNQSVAEQNSLDVSWDILMTGQFDKLRKCLFGSIEELKRFYQVLVNVVLATDIFDKELNGLRKIRWNKAFHDETVPKEEANDLRATVVIEHIIQASDVSHTMQHWHVYRKWNRRLFLEMSKAYKEGRMGADPASFWYKGELGFFDNYIIPLAKKLKECQVFGVSSDEYLNYAVKNRAEWAERGEEIVAEMMKELEESKHISG